MNSTVMDARPTRTPSRTALRERIERNMRRELERCRIAHGASWPAHRDWLIAYLNAGAREWMRVRAQEGRL